MTPQNVYKNNVSRLKNLTKSLLIPLLLLLLLNDSIKPVPQEKSNFSNS